MFTGLDPAILGRVWLRYYEVADLGISRSPVGIYESYVFSGGSETTYPTNTFP